MNPKLSTSWQPVAKWYNKLVGDKGQYYHEHVVIPGVLRLLSLDKNSKLLDLACGQGVLGRQVMCDYTGIDISNTLIEEAGKRDRKSNHKYFTADVTRSMTDYVSSVTHIAIVLALQNIENADAVIANCATHLEPNGKLVIVLNHPAFRIPRQTSWGIDEGNKLQYRRINRYLSPLKIPITAHPGEKQSAITWSFHQPISYYTALLTRAGFVIDAFEEWASDKESVGKVAKMENRSRAEIPLFMAIRAVLINRHKK